MADTKKEYTSNLHPKGDLDTTVYPNVKCENIIDKDTTTSGYTAGKVPDSELVSKSMDSLNEKIETNKIQTDANKTNIATLQGDVASLKTDNQTTKTTIAGLVSSDSTNKKNIADNTQNIENLSAVMPTDINVDENGYAILEHDGTEITGQKKKVKFTQPDKPASFSEVTIPSAKDLKTKDGTGFGSDFYEINMSDATTTDNGDDVQVQKNITKDIFDNIRNNKLNISLINLKDLTGEFKYYYSGELRPTDKYVLIQYTLIGYLAFQNYFLEIISDGNGNYIVNFGTLTYITNEDLNDKQDKLVSGTNIKTINGNSILGEGDMSVGEKPFYELNLSSITDDATLTKEQGEAIYNNGNLLDIKIILGEQGTFYFVNGKTKINVNGETFFYNPISWQLFDDIIEGLVFNKNGDTYTISFIRFSTPNTIELGSNNEIKLVNAFESSYMKTINGQSLVQGGSTDDIKVQSILYRHTVEFSESGLGYVNRFTAYSEKNTPIDSIQDLITVFGNTKLQCSGTVEGGSNLCIGIDVGTTADTTFFINITGVKQKISNWYTTQPESTLTITDEVTAM